MDETSEEDVEEGTIIEGTEPENEEDTSEVVGEPVDETETDEDKTDSAQEPEKMCIRDSAISSSPRSSFFCFSFAKEKMPRR